MPRLLVPIIFVISMLALPAVAMNFLWTRTTGQFRYESTPVLTDTNGDGQQEILGVNNGGQVLLWSMHGKDIGAGQDGMVTALPEGVWTSSPAIYAAKEHWLAVFVSTDGLVVALRADWSLAWQVQLTGKTQWSRATPLIITDSGEVRFIIGDLSSTVTCISLSGDVVWKRLLPSEGGCSAPLLHAEFEGAGHILAPCGSVLHDLKVDGTVMGAWDLSGRILSQPLAYYSGDIVRLFCGAGSGELFALNVDHSIRWTAHVGDEIDTSIAVLPRTGEEPLVVCTGLWGNVHAFSLDGQHVWTHVFRAKSRTRPLVHEVNGDGSLDLLVAAYDQHAYAIDAEGNRIDDIRLSGAINASPIVLPRERTKDVLFVSATLLAHCFETGPVRLPFAIDDVAPTAEVRATMDTSTGHPMIVVENPSRAQIAVNASTMAESGGVRVVGEITAQDVVAIPLSGVSSGSPIAVTIKDVKGNVLFDHPLDIPAIQRAATVEGESLAAWETPSYADFDPSRLAATPAEMAWGALPDRSPVLYRGECGQVAVVVANRGDKSVQAVAEVLQPKGDGDRSFSGALRLREVVVVETRDGGWVPDALPELGNESMVTIPPKQAVKIWISIATVETLPGPYRSELTLSPLSSGVAPVTIPIEFAVSPLVLPKSNLTFCTWDYLPNQWFGSHTDENLDDMLAHGVDVFPRTVLPAARMENGALTIDFDAFKSELDRLAGRGTLLVQLAEPAIAGSENLNAEDVKRLQVEYIRALRDFLLSNGWTYDQFALYPVDEPGLDYGPRVPVFIRAAQLFREADPELRIYTDPVPGLSLRDFEAIAPLVDVWCPNMRMTTGLLFEDPRMKAMMASNGPVWSYECIADVKSTSPLRYNRGNAWRAYYFGLDGIGHWTYSTTQANHWHGNPETNDEYALVYPGERPVPSVRWEAVRDGLEDIAAMHMLKDLIAEASKESKERTVAWETATRVTGSLLECVDDAFVESRDYLRAGDRTVWHTWWDALAFDKARNDIERVTLELQKANAAVSVAAK
ncbi:MAG: hypothetical protein AMXMBFR84_25150 [Candidatus Hydrogenedentota bacterium]